VPSPTLRNDVGARMMCAHIKLQIIDSIGRGSVERLGVPRCHIRRSRMLIEPALASNGTGGRPSENLPNGELRRVSKDATSSGARRPGFPDEHRSSTRHSAKS
jgi:hypothetical protein